MTAPAHRDLCRATDRAEDCRLLTHALEIALRGANMDTEEQNALTTLASSNVGQLQKLVDELNALRQPEAAP